MKYLFTADWHLGHDNIIQYCKRPFCDVTDMAEEFVRRYNEVVEPGDTVYFLGDTVWKKEAGDLYLPRLKGNKIHVTGGHDHRYFKQTNCPIVHFHPKGEPELYLCHYPLLTWPGWEHDVRHLHGHQHGNGARRAEALDVGVDVWNFYPVELAKVMEYFQNPANFFEIKNQA